jgi:large subunit ribosomal protein L18e
MRKNKELLYLLSSLRKASNKYNAPIWRRVAELLDKPKRRSVAVNLSRINRYTKKGDWIVVPGKVLGSGIIDHNVYIAAFSFSETAYKKLKEANCKILKIEELIKKKPSGNGVKIIV